MKSETVMQSVDENDPVVSPPTKPIPAKAVDRCEDVIGMPRALDAVHLTLGTCSHVVALLLFL